MKLSKYQKIAFIFAALILLGGALLLTFPASEPASSSSTPVGLQTNYGTMLLQMVIAVALVCLLAYAILKWGLQRMVGARDAAENMEVLSRMPIGPSRSIMVVRVGPRFLIVGSSETEISLLGELSEEEAFAHFDLQTTEQ